jgi:methylase of polypeptide subunit release factors
VVDARLGDAYAPVGDERFDLIASNPPQMPTPPGRERADATAAADNGGLDGWEVLDRIIAGAPAHLDAGGRLVFTIFAFLGRKAAFARCEAAGLSPRIVASELQSFPRIGYERLEHLRAVDAEGSIGTVLPERVERFVVEGRLA